MLPHQPHILKFISAIGNRIGRTPINDVATSKDVPMKYPMDA